MLSIGDVDNKPIVLGDNVLLINLSEDCRISYNLNDIELEKKMKAERVPDMFNIEYGYMINYFVGNGEYRTICNFETLLRRKDVTIDLLKQEKVDFNEYLEKFTRQSRAKKLKRLKEIAD
jgi:hypothetical protein